MAYIYYIARTKETSRGGYVGQDIGNIYNDDSRIIQHARTAYGLDDKKIYGSERLIKQSSLSGLYYRIYDSELDCFGVGQKAFNTFKNFWIHSKPNSIQEKLDFAEMCHIFIGNLECDFASTNIRIGGQNTWTFNDKGFLQEYAKKVDQLQRKKSAVSYQDILAKDTNQDLSRLTIHYPDSIYDGVKIFEPQGYMIARLIAKGITKQFLSDSESWQQFLIDTIINHLKELLTLSESNLQQKLTQEIRNYIDNAIHNELLDWQRITKLEFSFKLRLDVASDISRIVKVLAKRIKQVGKYAVENQLKYLLYSGKTQNKDKIANEVFTKSGEKFNITRNAYIVEIKYTNPSNSTSPWTSWYRMAVEYWKSAPYRSIKDDPTLALMLKKVSYEAFKKWVNNAIKKEPMSRGQTIYEQKAFGSGTGEGFYRGGKNEIYLGLGEYNLNKSIKSLRWKVRDEVENQDIHGDILHWWDTYYRFMSTVWLRDEHNSKLVEDGQDDRGNNVYRSEYSGERYFFTDGTWQEIQEYQSKSLKDIWIY